jgi:hypothetical protein
MSIFDSLAKGSFLGSKAPPGFRARQRAETSSPERDEMDAKVLAAGGRVEVQDLRSNGLGGGRMLPRSHRVSWYVIPEEHFEED